MEPIPYFGLRQVLYDNVMNNFARYLRGVTWSGRRRCMFKIHAGECSGTRSDFNSNSTFMPVCMCSYVCVYAQWYVEKIASLAPVHLLQRKEYEEAVS